MRLLERLGETTVARFEANFTKSSGCWLWRGALSNGYGHFGFMGRVVKAHRFAFMLYKDKIPPGLLVRHSCDIPACVNPEHLILGTRKDNTLDAAIQGRLGVQRKFPAKPW